MKYETDSYSAQKTVFPSIDIINLITFKILLALLEGMDTRR